MFIRYKYAILSSVILIGLVIYVANKRIPIPTGDAEDYWQFACGVEVDKFDGYFPFARETGIFSGRDGWYFYYFREHHGRHVFKVSKESLQSYTSQVFNLLDLEIFATVQENTRDKYLAKSNSKRLACLDVVKSVNSDQDQFIAQISVKFANKYDNESFNRQWQRSKRYWLSIVFEGFFLPFWWLFSFHSGVFGKFNKSLAIRLGFSPLLLFFPHFLGYAPYLFSFGASGGILYPLFTGLLSLPLGWLPFNPIDIHILKLIPQPLTYISQIPFSPAAMSFRGSVSPTVLCVYAGVVLIISKLILRYRAKKQS